MTFKQIAAMIERFGVPSAYYQFDEETIKAEGITPPFVTWYYDRSDDLYADNSNYQKIVVLHIELYADSKDFALESTVEQILNENEITYTKSETFIEDELLFMTVYESEVIING